MGSRVHAAECRQCMSFSSPPPLTAVQPRREKAGQTASSAQVSTTAVVSRVSLRLYLSPTPARQQERRHENAMRGTMPVRAYARRRKRREKSHGNATANVQQQAEEEGVFYEVLRGR